MLTNFITKREAAIMIEEAKKDMSKIISNRIKTYENNKIGRIFEENIRNILLIKFKWEESKIPRAFFLEKYMVEILKVHQ